MVTVMGGAPSGWLTSTNCSLPKEFLSKLTRMGLRPPIFGFAAPPHQVKRLIGANELAAEKARLPWSVVTV